MKKENWSSVLPRYQSRQHHILPDGNGDFSRGMGMRVPMEDLGFGDRSWHYSMLVNDGVVEKMLIEPDLPGDPFEVSDSDTMLEYLALGAAKPLDATLFTLEGYPFCARAKGMLKDAGIAFDELLLNHDYSEIALHAVASASRVPQVFINGEHVGGSDALETCLARHDQAAA